MISKVFRFQLFLTKKISSKGRTFTGRTGPIRGANHPAGAITMRCNHNTNHVKGRSRAASGPRQGAQKYAKVLGEDPSKQIFRFWRFTKKNSFSLNKSICLHHAKPLFGNVYFFRFATSRADTFKKSNSNILMLNAFKGFSISIVFD